MKSGTALALGSVAALALGVAAQSRAGSPVRRASRPVDLSWLPEEVFHGTCSSWWDDSKRARFGMKNPGSLCVSDRRRQAEEYARETAAHLRAGTTGIYKKDAGSWPILVLFTRADLLDLVARGATLIGDYGVDDYDEDDPDLAVVNAGAARSYGELGTFCIRGTRAIDAIKSHLYTEDLVDEDGDEDDGLEDEDE